MRTDFFEIIPRHDDEGKFFELYLCHEGKKTVLQASEFLSILGRKCQLTENHDRMLEILDEAILA